jgi:hypothetical protein
MSVSLQPSVTCSGEHRWFQEIPEPQKVAGSTRVKTSLILAAWRRVLPGSTDWLLIGQNQFLVFDGGQQSGKGHTPIWPYNLAFSGRDLATSFNLEAGVQYLLGVVGQVSVWSTLTDEQGRPLPLIENGTFNVWGSLGCAVPRIEVIEQ